MRASSETIWALWNDVEGSPRWDTDVTWSRLAGDFAPGTEGELKLKNGLRARLRISAVEQLKSYENVVWFAPGLSVRFGHELQELNQGYTRVVHTACVEGRAGRLLRPLLEPVLRGALDRALLNLRQHAESAFGEPA